MMEATHAFEPLDRPAPTDGQAAAEKAATEREETISWVRGQIEAAIAIPGTAGERYLVEHRGLRGPWPAALRWAVRYRSSPAATPRSCLLAIATDSTGAVIGLQAIAIDVRTGDKLPGEDHPKRSRGPISEGTAYLGDAGESPPVLALGEGVETILTRRLVGPCDAHACLGPVRWVEPQRHHKRVEVLADTNARETARKLARRYADLGYAAYVVTVPDSLGAKADLNDLVRDLGETAVRMAVEDAERIEPASAGRQRSEYALALGSDIEIAQQLIDKLEDMYGPVVVDEGTLWRFDRTHWVPIDSDQLARLIHKADGAVYGDADGKPRFVRLNRSRVASIADAIVKYRVQPGFFAAAPAGINCASGFIQIGDDGSTTFLPHGRRWRRRHVVRGRWPCEMSPEQRADSLLGRYLRETFEGDPDAAEKINLVGELLGCTAIGWGTRLRSPKAVVAHSEEGGTGKSTLLHLLRWLPNPEAVASVPPGKFGDEKYAHRLIGKVLNAADELPDKAVKADVFKRMVTGEPVPARDVYKSATDFRPTALHVFSTNVLPNFTGGVDGGVVRRLLPMPFNHVVPEDKRDPDLPARILAQEADLLLDFAVEGAQRLIKARDFTVPASSKELLDRWTTWADPVRAWASERLEVTPYESVLSVATLYDDFAAWAERRRFNVDLLPSVIGFGKRLRSACPALAYHRSDGSKVRNVRLRGASA
jgi:P4 family phage/plasmid primase-like protien